MSEAISNMTFEDWLSIVRVHVSDNAPELLSLLDVYLGEARFGRQFIAADLMMLSPGAAVLEVGAGSLLLSCQLVSEGFKVTALEPIGSGFSHFGRMRELVLNRAEAHGFLPRVLNQKAEELVESSCYDYAFSINVMEHVEDPALSLAKIGLSLKAGAVYRFTCPNYLFPYEPHFNIPTLFSKRLTEIFLGKYIFKTNLMPDPGGTWKSLNWIDVTIINKSIKHIPDLRVVYNRNIFFSTIERTTIDSEFAKRRSGFVGILISVILRLRLHYLFRFIPVLFQPIIDCRITRENNRRRAI
jgi:2-polyprenyl-3-methyl-5-hydroxy-6-metoxy-1,4-benzoquinol methylase